MEHKARESGEILDGRWVVFGSGRTTHGDVTFVRDQRWRSAKRVLIPSRPNWDDSTFHSQTRRWRDHGAHPNLVAGYHTMEIAGQRHFVAEYLSAPTLADRFRGGAAVFPSKVALRLATQIVAGLAHMHESGWAHGDLQPETVLLPDRDTVRLSGFWLGEPRTFTDRQRQPYWAPEIYAAEKLTPTPATDIYALGVLLYQMLTGHPPFGTDDDTRARWHSLFQGASPWARFKAMLPFGTQEVPKLSADLESLLGKKRFPAARRVDLMRGLHTLAPVQFFPEDPTISPPLVPILEACLAKRPDRRPKASVLHAHLLAHSREVGLKLDEWPVALDEPAVNARAVAYAEMGEISTATEILDTWLAEHPLSLYAWANRKILEVHEEPSALPRVLQELDADIRSQPGATVDQGRVGEILEYFTRDLLYLRGLVSSVCIQKDGARVALGGSFVGGIRLWDVADGGSTVPLKGGTGRPCQYVFLTPEGGLLVEASGDLLQVVNIESGDVLWTKRFPNLSVDARCSPSGVWTAVCVPGRVLLLDTRSGQLKDWVSLDADAPLSTVRWRPDERALAVCTPEEILVCDLLDRSQVSRLSCPVGPAKDMLFTPDGERLVVADGSAVVRVVDPADGTVLQELTGHEQSVHCLAIDDEGRRLLTGCVDQTARLWSLETAETLRVLFGGKKRVSAVTFWPGDHRMLVGDAKGGVRLWQAEQELGELFIGGGEADGGAQGTLHRNVREQSLLLHDRGSASGFILSVLGARVDWSHKYDAAVNAVAFGPNSEQVVAGLPHATFVSQVSGRAVHVDAMQLHHDAEVFGVAFNPDGTHVVVGAGRGSHEAPPASDKPPPGAWLRAINDTMERSFLIGPGGLTIGRSSKRDAVIDDLGVSRHHCTVRYENGKFLIKDEGAANGIFVNSVRLWEATLEDGDEVRIGGTTLKFNLLDHVVEEPTTTLIELADLQNPDSVKWEELSAHLDGTAGGIHRSNVAVVWRIEDGKAIRELAGHAAPIRAVAYTNDGSMIVTGSEDGVVIVWDAATGRAVRTLLLKGANADGNGVTSVAVSPDDRFVLAGYGDGSARLWHRESGKPVRHLTGHTRGVTAVAFSTDGRRLLTGSSDGTAILWNARLGEKVARLKGHTGPITAVCFSLDDHVMLTGSQDGTARLWSRISHKELYVAEIKSEGVTSVHFSPDGRMLVAGGADGSVQVWLMRWFWAFLDDALVVLDKVFDDPKAQTMFWQRSEVEGDLDYWLDIWTDIRRCASEDSPRDPEKLGKTRSRLQYTLLDLVRRAGSPTKGRKNVVPLGLDAVRALTTPEVDPEKQLASYLYAVECADPELAERFRS